jgi:hypothetical protein
VITETPSVASSTATQHQQTYAGPPPPREGQAFTDRDGGHWKIKRLTVAANPGGFYLVHLSYGQCVDSLDDSMVLGPREFAALLRDRDLKPHLHSV